MDMWICEREMREVCCILALWNVMIDAFTLPGWWAAEIGVVLV